MCPECFHVVAQSLRHFSMAAGLRLAMARLPLMSPSVPFCTQRPPSAPLGQHGRTSPLIGPSKNPPSWIGGASSSATICQVFCRGIRVPEFLGVR